MLKNIPSIISPLLLKTLMKMGHGDEIVIADGNFPGERVGANSIVIRLDGHNTPEILDAILKFMPLDEYSENPIALMKVPPWRDFVPVIWNKYDEIIKNHEPIVNSIEYMERFAFYDRAKTAYAIVTTSEMSEFANILLKKGVVKI